MSNRYNGTVKWFNDVKGFGFIQLEDNNELFVHHSEIKTNGYMRASLLEGQKISCEIGTTEKGDCAKSVETL